MENLDFYRTDLLVENEEMVRHQTESEKDRLKEANGIEFNETRQGRIVVTEVKVDETGEKRIGKEKRYLCNINCTYINDHGYR